MSEENRKQSSYREGVMDPDGTNICIVFSGKDLEEVELQLDNRLVSVQDDHCDFATWVDNNPALMMKLRDIARKKRKGDFPVAFFSEWVCRCITKGTLVFFNQNTPTQQSGYLNIPRTK